MHTRYSIYRSCGMYSKYACTYVHSTQYLHLVPNMRSMHHKYYQFVTNKGIFKKRCRFSFDEFGVPVTRCTGLSPQKISKGDIKTEKNIDMNILRNINIDRDILILYNTLKEMWIM